MYDGQPGHLSDGLLQFLRRLSRQRQHQIAGQIVKSCRCGSADGLDRLLRRVQPTQPFQLSVRKRLHPERQPVYAAFPKPAQLFRCGSGRVCLHCHLCIRGQGETIRRRFQDLCNLCRRQQRRCAAAKINGIHRFCTGIVPQIPADRLGIAFQQFRFGGDGIEVAVRTLPAAKRHMDIKSGSHQLSTSFRIGFSSGPKKASKIRHNTYAATIVPAIYA